MSFQVTSNSSPEYKLMNVVIKQSFWLKMDGTWDRWGCGKRSGIKGPRLTGKKFYSLPTWQHFWSKDFIKKPEIQTFILEFIPYPYHPIPVGWLGPQEKKGEREKHKWKLLMIVVSGFYSFVYYLRNYLNLEDFYLSFRWVNEICWDI